MSAKRLCLSPTCRLARHMVQPRLFTPAFPLVTCREASAAAASIGPTFNVAATASDKNKVQTAQRLAQAVEHHSLSALRRLYPRLIAAVVSKTGETSDLSTVLDRRVLLGAMRDLADSCATDNGDYELLWRIFEDLQRVFLLTPNVQECACVVTGMVNRGLVREAYQWLKTLPALYRVSPSTHEWNLLLKGIEKHFNEAIDMSAGAVEQAAVPEAEANFSLLHAVYNDMLDAGAAPNIDSYNALLSAFAAKGNAHQLRSGLEEMQRRGLSANVRTHAILLRGALSHGDIVAAEAAARALMAHVSTSGLDIDAWNALINLASLVKAADVDDWSSEDDATRAMLAGGPEAVVKLMAAHSVEASAATLTELVRSDQRRVEGLASAALVIDNAEDLTGLTIDAKSVAIIIRRLLSASLTSSAVDAAMAIYREAVHGDRAVVPTNDLVLPLLHALASEKPEGANSVTIAKGLYADLQAAYENGFVAVPSVAVYEALFDICASSTSGSSWAEQLLTDMQKYQHTLSLPALLQHAGTVMRVSPSYEAAQRLLLGFHQLNPRMMDSAGAESLLQLFLSLPIADEPAPYEKTTTVVQQMRFVSAFLGTKGYCSLFRHYGGDNASGMADARAVQRFHTILNLDRFYEPETAVFNELIRAYANAGAFDAAWAAWESMLLTPQRAMWDQGTILSVLDLCGSAVGGQVLDPRPVWRLARTREGVDPLFRLPKAAWDAWVGALARIGSARQLDYATDVVTGQMGRAESFREPLEGVGVCARAVDPPLADASTLDMLLRYAHAKGGQELLGWLRRRLHRQLPDLYALVSDVERFEWDEVRRLREQCGWPDFGDEPWHNDTRDIVTS